jgi:toxin YoeB
VNVNYTNRAYRELKFWDRKNHKIVDRIELLIGDILQNGLMTGIGKPERLKYGAGYSRRIDEEHRLVYNVKDGDLWILSCSNHY